MAVNGRNVIRTSPALISALYAIVREGLVTVLDLGPETECSSGHLLSAFHIPWPDLKKCLAQLQREIVAC